MILSPTPEEALSLLRDENVGSIPIDLTGILGYFGGGWLFEIHTNMDAAFALERGSAYDAKGAASSQMLVIRGVDDEASLALAAGSIGSRLGYLFLAGLIPIILLVVFFVPPSLFSGLAGIVLCSPIFLVLPGVIKSFFFGREFLVNWLVCDIAVDSVPDTSGQAEVITLIPVERASSEREWTSVMLGVEVKSRVYKRDLGQEVISSGFRFRRFGEGGGSWRLSSWQLRHRIYNHPHCVDEIVRWLHRVT
jgi:hypothetical protein